MNVKCVLNSVCVCPCVCSACMFVCVCVCKRMSVHVCLGMYLSVNVEVDLNEHVLVDTDIHDETNKRQPYVQTYIPFTCIRIHLHKNAKMICIYMCLYIYKYSQIDIHGDTQIDTWPNTYVHSSTRVRRLHEQSRATPGPNPSHIYS